MIGDRARIDSAEVVCRLLSEYLDMLGAGSSPIVEYERAWNRLEDALDDWRRGLRNADEEKS